MVILYKLIHMCMYSQYWDFIKQLKSVNFDILFEEYQPSDKFNIVVNAMW